MAEKKTTKPSATKAAKEGVVRKVNTHHLKTVDEAWHRCRVFAVNHNLTVSQCFEIAFMMISKYESEPEKIGPKIFEIIKEWKERGSKHALDLSEF